MPSRQELRDAIAELAVEHAIPGAAMALYRDGEVTTASTGYGNVRERVEMTDDTVYLIGSITKVWTATLVMMFVDEGLVDLDTPVRNYLPDLRLQDADALAAITPRHLITHTSGLSGDYFQDFGSGDGALTRYVASLEEVIQLMPPGHMPSYGNSGFCIAGRMLEVLSGKTYHDLLRERIFGPLGLTRSALTPAEQILYRVSVSHYKDPASGDFKVFPVWQYPPSMSPAGTTLACSVSDLMAFGRMHMNDGCAPDGTRLLSSGAIAQMQTPQYPWPYPDYGGMGLGWMLFDGYGSRCVAHGGGSPSGLDYLRIFPDIDTAIVWYGNHLAPAATFGRAVEERVLRDMLGIDVPAGFSTGEPSSRSLDRYQGEYVHARARFNIRRDGDGLALSTSTVSPFPPHVRFEGAAVPLRPFNGEMFSLSPTHESIEDGTKILFLEHDDDGRPAYLHTGFRAYKRVS